MPRFFRVRMDGERQTASHRRKNSIQFRAQMTLESICFCSECSDSGNEFKFNGGPFLRKRNVKVFFRANSGLVAHSNTVRLSEP